MISVFVGVMRLTDYETLCAHASKAWDMKILHIPGFAGNLQ